MGCGCTTIVLMSPNLAAMRAASKADIPARMFAPKNMLPSTPSSTPKRTRNQYAIRLWMTSPPAKASTANKAESLATTPRDWCKPSVRRMGFSSAPRFDCRGKD